MTQQEHKQIQQLNEVYYLNFVNALKSKTTKTDYTKRLKYFMDFLGLKQEDYSELITNKDKKWICKPYLWNYLSSEINC